MSSIRVRVPATSANLGPGFDTLGLALQLYNFVTVATSDDGRDKVTTTGEGAAELPCDNSNIALHAARSLWQTVGAPDEPCHLQLQNAIPLARGLGSSAAARVGGLVAANEWSRHRGWPVADKAQLLNCAVALEGHPDNAAAALLGGLTAAVNLDDAAGALQSRAVRVEVPAFPRLVVFIPDSELATAAAREVLPDNVFRSDAVFNLGRTSLLLGALTSGRWDLLSEALHDRLHQEHRAVLMPAFQSVVRAAAEAGAFGATLSGAGPSILAWLPDDPDIEREVMLAMPDAAAEHEVFGAAKSLQVDLQGCVVAV